MKLVKKQLAPTRSTKDEGPRARHQCRSIELSLRPVFANGGTVTAGNSSQMSDGAAFVMVMSEDYGQRISTIEPIARMVNYAVAGVPPKIMGIGPVKLPFQRF